MRADGCPKSAPNRRHHAANAGDARYAPQRKYAPAYRARSGPTSYPSRFEIFHNRFCEFCEFNKSYSRKSQSSMEPAKLTLRRFTTPGPKSAISLDFPCITGKTPAFAPAENTGAGSKGNRIFGITAPTTAIFRKKRIIPAGIRSKYRAKIFPLIRKSRIFAHQKPGHEPRNPPISRSEHHLQHHGPPYGHREFRRRGTPG